MDITDKSIFALIHKEFYRIILANKAMWVNMLDNDGNVILWNKAAEILSGYSEDEAIGNNVIWELLYPNEEYRKSIYNKALLIINQEKTMIDFETTIRCKDGSQRILSWNSHNVRDDDNTIIGSIALARDVTEIKAREEELHALSIELELSNKQLLKLSLLDPLTKIANRRAYEERLYIEINRVKRTGEPLALLMIDIDYFKQYNDIYGHKKGDEVLYLIANTISESLPRKTDFIARYGGEEFVAILPYTSANIATSITQKLLQRVIDKNIEHSYSTNNKLLTVSIGLSTTATGSEDLFSEADKALYSAKLRGRNRYEIYARN